MDLWIGEWAVEHGEDGSVQYLCPCRRTDAIQLVGVLDAFVSLIGQVREKNRKFFYPFRLRQELNVSRNHLIAIMIPRELRHHGRAGCVQEPQS